MNEEKELKEIEKLEENCRYGILLHSTQANKFYKLYGKFKKKASRRQKENLERTKSLYEGELRILYLLLDILFSLKQGKKNKESISVLSNDKETVKNLNYPLSDFNPFENIEKEFEQTDKFLRIAKEICTAYDIFDPRTQARIISIRKGFFADKSDFVKTVIETENMIFNAVKVKVSSMQNDNSTSTCLSALKNAVEPLIGKSFAGITLTYDCDFGIAKAS